MNFDALVWQQWVILGYALLEHFILIGTLRETKAKPGSACVPVAQARHSLRARADHLRLARRHCDLPSDAAGGDKEQVVNTTSLNDRAAGSLHRRRAKGGQVRPRSRFASGGRGQRPGSRSIRPPSTAIASTSPPRTPLTGHAECPCERGAMDTAGFDS